MAKQIPTLAAGGVCYQCVILDDIRTLEMSTDNASLTASCDFETDLCGWRHVNTSSAMYWRRHRAPAPRRSNGPSYDHTRRTDQG